MIDKEEQKKIKKKIREKKEVPNIKKKTKGMIGDLFVESILLDGTPCFLTNESGKIKTHARIEYDGLPVMTPLS